MGSGGAKKTNQMLAEETAASRRQQETAAQRSADIYGASRGDIDWGREQLKGLYTGLGQSSGGGGGGGGYTPAKFGDETMDFYRKMMTQGQYSPEDIGMLESRADAPIRGIADMISRRLQSQAAGSGGGYASGLGSLFADQSHAASEAAKGAMADALSANAASRFQGAAGLEDIETKRRAFEAQERARRAAAAARASSGADADLATKRSLINQILGLEGDKDLAYMDRELAGRGQSIGSVTSRVDETPMWQKMGADLLKTGAGAAAGAFSGGLTSFLPKKGKAGSAPVTDKYGPQYG